VSVTEECVKWGGSFTDKKYGRIWVNDRHLRAHRFVWEQSNGPIPLGGVILHTCDNPSCVNLSHLKLGTQADNMRDMSLKGRHNNQMRDITHCKKGHEFTESNTYITSRGGRQCKACCRLRSKEFYYREKQFANQ
jgi:hypothetical protein